MSIQLLKNKVVIVTGGSGGIGNAIVNRLSNCEANVISVFHHNLPANISDENVFWFQSDLTRSEEWERLLNYTLEKFRKVDVLVNCAGILEPGEFCSIDISQLRKMVELNLTSVLIGILKTSVIMKDQGYGHIINIGSLGGIVPMPYSSVYSATKFALRGFSLSLFEELKGTNVKVSLITPGSVITKMLDYEAQAENSAISFLGKPISPAKVAESVLKLINKTKVELIIPRSQSISSKLLVFSPKVFSVAYKLLHRLGLSGKRKYLNRYCNFSLMKGAAR
jgi:3-oxoacyl-[acyl-carrier protein] reductase